MTTRRHRFKASAEIVIFFALFSQLVSFSIIPIHHIHHMSPFTGHSEPLPSLPKPSGPTIFDHATCRRRALERTGTDGPFGNKIGKRGNSPFYITARVMCRSVEGNLMMRGLALQVGMEERQRDDCRWPSET